ncbi:hypothetical protein CTAYLR_009397 [Chrysophaeum taylorii]|uniref:Ankyrin repeat protein n=1 Tax=Chrysophaeum taylorii TaxID=2483200 RepID=A0AAD7UIV5_9STRA|nr:hypothetical protein CTAYLR_009397 [Chrysophaeum taylorii]
MRLGDVAEGAKRDASNDVTAGVRALGLMDDGAQAMCWSWRTRGPSVCGCYEELFDECRDGSAACVSQFLEAGLDANWSDERGRTALYVACCDHRPNTSIVAALLRGGANPALAPNGKPPLCVVCAHDRDPERARLLLDAGADPNDARYPGHRTPLALAARVGATAVIFVLLARGALLNVRDDHGYTPVDIACDRGCVDALRALVDHNSHLRSCPTAPWPANLPFALPPTSTNADTDPRVSDVLRRAFGGTIFPDPPAEPETPPSTPRRPVHPIAALLRHDEAHKWLDLRLSKRRAFLEGRAPHHRGRAKHRRLW